MKEEPRNRYLVKYRFAKGAPVKTSRTFLTAVYVDEEIGEEAAMELAEKLHAEYGRKIKAISAEYQTDLVIRTFQKHHKR
jgi:acetylornithine deacetylase/succinyl-diaminopimelate desuccinylase-like protein